MKFIDFSLISIVQSGLWVWSQNNKTLKLNNYGNHARDFTYISDVIEIINLLIFTKPRKNHEIFNICSNKPIRLKTLIRNFDRITGKKGKLIKVTLQKTEVIKTHGDNSKINQITKKRNYVNFFEGLKKTYKWFEKYHKIL